MEKGIKVAVVCSMNLVSIWFLVSHELEFTFRSRFVRLEQRLIISRM